MVVVLIHNSSVFIFLTLRNMCTFEVAPQSLVEHWGRCHYASTSFVLCRGDFVHPAYNTSGAKEVAIAQFRPDCHGNCNHHAQDLGMSHTVAWQVYEYLGRVLFIVLFFLVDGCTTTPNRTWYQVSWCNPFAGKDQYCWSFYARKPSCCQWKRRGVFLSQPKVSLSAFPAAIFEENCVAFLKCKGFLGRIVLHYEI